LRHVSAIVGGLFVAVVVYAVVWFFVRNMVAGLGTRGVVGGHLLVILFALAVGFSSFRASLARR
jgi:hypothetical protein